MAQTVTISGPFTFKTVLELDAIREAIKSGVGVPGLIVVNSTLNGQNLQFQVGPEKFSSAEIANALKAAYCSIGIYKWGAPECDRSVARFY